MVWNFPNTPVNGQQFTPSGGPTYIWNGTGWTVQPLQSSALPDAPNDGNQYGRQSATWTQVVPNPAASSTLPIMDGTAAIGAGTAYARNDHVHPSDTTKLSDAPNDGLTYGRRSAAWATIVGGAVISDTAPTGTLQNGQMWWESDSGNLYIYYTDADSSQWIMVAAGFSPTSPTAAAKTARTRNRITNPTAQVSQENGTNPVTANQTYPADQWVFTTNIASTTGQKGNLTSPTPEGTMTIVAIWATVAKASLAASDIMGLVLPVEGLDVADLDWGTTSAKPVVLRFAVNCDVAGTYAVSLLNSASTRSWCGSFTIATAGVTQVFSIAIPGDTTGTWLTDTGIGVNVRFTYAAGTTYVGVAGWQAGAMLAPPGCTNGIAQASKVLRITDVGLYKDPDNTGLPPPFDPPSYEDDLFRCLRYWETGTAFVQLPVAGFGGMSMPYAVKKRLNVTPAFTGITYNTASSLTYQGSNVGFFHFNWQATGGGGNLTFNWTANARLI